MRLLALASLALVACAHRAEPSRASLQRLNPPGVAPPAGAYTHLAIVPPGSELLVLAGQVGVDASGALAPDVEGQLRNALANARAILRSAGAGPAQVIKVNLWLTRPLPRERFQSLWGEFHGGAPPPTTLAYVSQLARPEYFVEVEVWAARPGGVTAC